MCISYFFTDQNNKKKNLPATTNRVSSDSKQHCSQSQITELSFEDMTMTMYSIRLHFIIVTNYPHELLIVFTFFIAYSFQYSTQISLIHSAKFAPPSSCTHGYSFTTMSSTSFLQYLTIKINHILSLPYSLQSTILYSQCQSRQIFSFQYSIFDFKPIQSAKFAPPSSCAHGCSFCSACSDALLAQTGSGAEYKLPVASICRLIMNFCAAWRSASRSSAV